MKKYDVTALGELLVDFTENGISEQGNALFEANPGGAPCNVLSMLQKLGKRTAFLGKVGQDAFGLRLRRNRESMWMACIWIRMCRPLWRWCRNCLTETGTSRSTGVPVRI